MKPLGDDGKTFVGELPWKPDNDAIAEAHPYGLREFSDNFRTVTRNLWENLPASANNNANLVAAIFVPGKGVWFSSIPHDAGDTLIINDKASAPAWYARSEQVYNEVSGGRPPGGLHAEDGAIYQFEKSQGHAHSLSAQQAQEWRFPDGTRLAVYGKYDHEDPEGFKGPCRGGKSRWPGCMQLITRLNIIRST
jgi:hypothetical protein